MEITSIVISPSLNLNPNPNPNVIQQVSKASSDQLLRKFAEIESDSETASSARKSLSSKRRRISTKMKRKGVINSISTIEDNQSYYNSSGGSCKAVERKSLLPQHYREKSSKRSSNSGGLLFKHNQHHLIRSNGGRNFRVKIVLSAIEKTWTKAIKGATKVFMEKHYNGHKMLINDMV